MTQNAANSLKTPKQIETEAQLAELKPIFTKVYLPMFLAGLLKFGIIHLVGKKMFPSTFTSLRRTYGIMYLAQLLTTKLKPTDEMKSIVDTFVQNGKISR